MTHTIKPNVAEVHKNPQISALDFLTEAKLSKKLSVCSVPPTLILTPQCASCRGHALCPENYLKNLKRCPPVDEILSVFITAEAHRLYTVIHEVCPRLLRYLVS